MNQPLMNVGNKVDWCTGIRLFSFHAKYRLLDVAQEAGGSLNGVLTAVQGGCNAGASGCVADHSGNGPLFSGRPHLYWDLASQRDGKKCRKKLCSGTPGVKM
ncbi:unnamed protein product [Pieris macdunnoughi]|uniref:Uncharacterized protein n=1 Tax=Pieris macdunnoughi TaxID=345717 RepID=A0A821S2C6_9NEOP|nr:unnamed protein product [Pieris macdunnoughi]